jgi:hypothetical protein
MFLDGKLLANGVDAEALPADRFMNLVAQVYLEDGMLEKEVRDARDEARMKLYRVYNGLGTKDQYGRSNDEAGDPESREPLPYIEPTEQTELGFVGLDAPLGG